MSASYLEVIKIKNRLVTYALAGTLPNVYKKSRRHARNKELMREEESCQRAVCVLQHSVHCNFAIKQ